MRALLLDRLVLSAVVAHLNTCDLVIFVNALFRAPATSINIGLCYNSYPKNPMILILMTMMFITIHFSK